MAEESVVNVRRKCLVKPAVPLPMKTMFLSNLDLFWIRFDNTQSVSFYKLPPTIEHSSAIEGLEKSLSLTLVYFYPLAGRLKSGEAGRTEIDLTDGGVEFKEASINVPFEDLEKDGFQRKPYFENLAPRLNDLPAEENSNKPLLSIQITAFEGSGICIGTTSHHVVADGNAFTHFMKSWAECSRGLPISNPPQHARTIFKREYNISPLISYKAHDIVSGRAQIFRFVPGDSQSQEDRETCDAEYEENKVAPIQKTPDLVHSTFCFTEEMIEELKRKSNASTSFVAVAAQFWRCIMRAQEVPQEETVSFVVAADCRRRVNPSLLSTYFGNCVSASLVQTRAETLVNADISFAADVIQQLISSCTEEGQINHLIDWVESCNRHILREANYKYGTVAISSPRFPLYDTDHGWGKPVDVQKIDDNNIGTMVLLPPKDGGKSIMVSTCLPQHQMEILNHLLLSGIEQHEPS